MPITKKTSKNQVTIPKDIVEKFPGIEYFEVLRRDREIVLRPVELPEGGERLSLIRDKMARLGLKERDIDEAVKWARQQ